MSTSNFFLKPPVLLAAIVLIGLIALSSGLKNQADRPDRADKHAEQGELNDLSAGGTRISKVSAPAVRSRRDTPTPRAAATPKPAPRKALVEDFEEALKRADGPSTISGKVFGTPNETDSDREERRRRFADLVTSATTGEANMDQMRNRWMEERTRRAKPVASAQVLLFENDPNTTNPPLRTAVTDDEGSFTLYGLNDADQRYIIVVKSDAYAPEANYVSMNNESRQVDFYLQEGVPLKGRVLDAETSEPIVGAAVYYPNPNWGTFAPLGVTTTTVGGEYSFPHVSTGRLLSQASARGYATSRVRLRAPDENSTIRLQPGGASISGVTIDRLTGKPTGGARVWATSGFRMSQSVLSKNDGTFEIADLPEGDYEVYAVRGMKSEVQHVTVKRQEEIKDVEIILPASVLVSGQVIQAGERTPLEGIKVWFESTKGSQYRRTDADGRFAFETMAIDEYSLVVHEKGLMPVGNDVQTSGSNEIITRKIAKNQSSDEVTIRLKSVRTLEGKVWRERGQGGFGGFGGRGGAENQPAAEANASGGSNNKLPANGAEVKLAYVDDGELIQLKTKSDAAGNFFFNLPKAQRGDGIVIASQNFMLDGRNVRVPRNRPIELTLGRNIAMGQVVLSDESPLDGISVSAAVTLPRRRDAESSTVHDVSIAQVNTMRGGRLFMGLPANQDVVLTFAMPDGNNVRKPFKTNELLRGNSLFIYDPISQDVLVDIRERNRGGRGFGGGGGNRGGGNRGEGNNRRPQQDQGQQNPAGSPQGATNLTGAGEAPPAQ